MIQSATYYRMDMPIADIFKICQGSVSFIVIALSLKERMDAQTGCEFLDYVSIIIMSQSFPNLFLYLIIFKKRGITFSVLW